MNQTSKATQTEPEKFRRAGTQDYDDDTDIYEAFLLGQSISDLAFSYNEPEAAIENAVRREFVRIRTGILKAWHNAIEKQTNLEREIADLKYQNIEANR